MLGGVVFAYQVGLCLAVWSLLGGLGESAASVCKERLFFVSMLWRVEPIANVWAHPLQPSALPDTPCTLLQSCTTHGAPLQAKQLLLLSNVLASVGYCRSNSCFRCAKQTTCLRGSTCPTTGVSTLWMPPSPSPKVCVPARARVCLLHGAPALVSWMRARVSSIPGCVSVCPCVLYSWMRVRVSVCPCVRVSVCPCVRVSVCPCVLYSWMRVRVSSMCVLYSRGPNAR